jgi:diadenylate cyclase
MQELLAIITHMELQDVVDIFVVSLLFYGLLILLRETRSAVALRGMVGILLFSFVIFFLAMALRLSATALIFRNFWTVAVLVFLIVFQNDFRRVLTEVGRLPVFRGSKREQAQSMGEIIGAVQRMAEKKIGALIAFERRNLLKVYADTGTALDAQVSSELLRTIFALYTPLHDGAVIIRGDRVVAAGCILPLAEETPIVPIVGMRHRAALGLSIETDGIVIVVSEETGTISLVHDGKMERGETPESLRAKLEKLLDIRPEEEEADGA